MDIVVKEDVRQTSEVPDASSANSSSEWQSTVSQTANKSSNAVVDSSQDDDLGFDPWDISARGLADLMEKEKVVNSYRPQIPPQMMHQPPLGFAVPPGVSLNGLHGFHHSRLKVMPPGFSSNGFPPTAANTHQPVFHHHMAALQQQQRSRMLSMMQSQSHPDNSVGQNPGTPPQLSRMSMPPSFQSGATRSLFMNPVESAPSHSSESLLYHRPPPTETYQWRDWQEGLKALLPNVNISFGNPPHSSFGANAGRGLAQSNGFLTTNNIHSNSQNANDKNLNDEAPPHWLASLHHLTEDNAPHANNHHSVNNSSSLFAQSPVSPPSSWFPPQTSRIFPPGFGLPSPTRPGPSAAAEAQLFGERQLSAS